MPRSARVRPPAAPSADRITLWAGCALSVVLSVWFTWGIWAPGVPAGDDSAAHLVRTSYAIDTLFAHGQLDGWQTSFGLGYQEFLFVGPGFTVVAALLKLLSAGGLSTVDAFKATVVLSFVALPLAMAFLAWAFGLGLRAAGAAAPLTWLISSVFGGAGLKGVFEGGLVPNQLASTFFVLALGGLVLVLRAPSPRRVVFTAVMGAATLYTHPIAAYILGFFGACVAAGAAIEWLRAHGAEVRALLPTLAVEDEPVDRRPDTDATATPSTDAPLTDPPLLDAPSTDAPLTDAPSLDAPTTDEPDPTTRTGGAVRAALGGPRRRVGALAGVGALGAGLAAAFLLPLAAHPELRGENSDWGDGELLKSLLSIWRGDAVFRPYVAIAVVVGWLFMVWRAWQRRPLALTLALTPVLYLLLGRILINSRPDNIVAIQMTNRGFGYVALLFVLPLAALIGTPPRPVTSLLHLAGYPAHRSAALAACNGLFPLLLVAALVVLPPRLGREAATTVTPTSTFQAAATTLRDVMQPGERFVTQREPARERALTGMSHPDLWLAAETGHDTLNIFNLTSSTVFGPVYEGENLTSRPPDREADELARLGISHVLLIDTTVAPDLLTSPRFHTVWRVGDMAILEVLPAAGQPDPATLVSAPTPVAATTIRRGPGQYTMDVQTPEATTVTLGVAWSTKWTVAVDGTPITPLATPDHLLVVPVPAGNSVVTLDYGIDRFDMLGRAISVLSVVLAASVLVADRRRRRALAAVPAVAIVTTAIPDGPADGAASGEARPTGAPEIGPEAPERPEQPVGPEQPDVEREVAPVASSTTETGEPDASGDAPPGDADLEVLTLAEAAALLRVDPPAVEHLLLQGTIPGRRMGDEWRLSRRALVTWLETTLDDADLPLTPGPAPTPGPIDLTRPDP